MNSGVSTGKSSIQQLATNDKSRTGEANLTSKAADTPLTLRDCREYVLTALLYGVDLYSSNGKQVGTANIATERQGEGEHASLVLLESFHGNDLEAIANEEGPHVVIRDTIICEDMKNLDYEGLHMGADDEPVTLKDLTKWAFYLWPLTLLRLHE